MRSLLASVLSLLIPCLALAQSPAAIDGQLFRPVAGEAFFAVGAAKVLPHLRPSVGLFLNFARNPLVVFSREDGEVALIPVANQAAFDVMLALGLFDRLEIGLSAPLSLAESGDDLGLIGGVGAVSGAHPGDIRLRVKASILGSPTQREGLFLSFAPEAKLPTGNGAQFTGSASTSLLLPLEASYRSGKLSLGGVIGPRIQETTALQNVVVGSELRFGLGASYALTPKVNLTGELDGAQTLVENNFSHVPTELRAGAKFGPIPGMWIPVGVGVGATRGVGAPDLRIFTGVTFAPEDQDPDKDGIKRSADKCPDVKEDKDGFEDNDGCPEDDNDKDGIADANDGQGGSCKNDPEDKDDFEDTDGCPDNDNDKDGIADADDACKSDPEDKDSFEDNDGCPELDNDKDLISDVDDACKNDPEDKDNFEDTDGCPDNDNDKDSFADSQDKCPNEPETKNEYQDDDGCPDEKAAVIGGKIVIVDKIFFDVNKASIKKVSFGILDEVARVIKENPQLKMVRVEGNASDEGTDKQNQRLSERRAEAVMKYLIKKGVAKERLEFKGNGESNPLVPLDSIDPSDKKKKEEVREKNRRVEFIIVE